MPSYVCFNSLAFNFFRSDISESIYKDLDKDAMRVILNSPEWSPGIKNGNPVKVKFNLPVSFVLE